MSSSFIIQKGPGIASKAFNYAKKLITGGGKQKTTGTEVIDKVKPNVPDTKLKKAKSNLNLAIQKSKASRAKLGQTLFESKNKAFRGDDFTFSYSKKKTPKVSEQKAKGGRVGLKRGTGLKRKSNVEKIKETFSPKNKIKFDAKKSDLDKSGDLSKYEKARGMAIAKAMAKRKNKKVIG